jgi:hypothetical protein
MARKHEISAIVAFMEMLPVSSSNLSLVGYDKADGSLHVRFKSGATYVYGRRLAA